MNLTSISGWLGSSLLLGNTPEAYGLALTAFAVTLLLIYLIKNLGIGRLKALAEKTETDLDDLALALTGKFSWFEYQLAAFFVATRYLQRAPAFDKVLKAAVLLVFTYRAITILQELLSYWITKVAAQRELSGQAKDSVVRSTQVILRAMIWVAAALFVLDNLGVNISAVLTGLGIGGVAVALAAQAILGDLFNFFVILLDKPFNIGDFIVSDAVSGTIEHIGLKSTRIRSLSGEVVVISNTNLLASRLRNYQDLTRRRIVFKTGIVHGTKPELLKKIPSIIKKAVQASEPLVVPHKGYAHQAAEPLVVPHKGYAHQAAEPGKGSARREPKVEFDRCNLYSCGDFSLDFETAYYLREPDYNAYMAAHEQVLLSVLEGLAAAGAELAYPTQTVLIKK